MDYSYDQNENRRLSLNVSCNNYLAAADAKNQKPMAKL
jgi:hypothetical protein